MEKNKRYPDFEEDESVGLACESALATAEVKEVVMPNDIPFAHIMDGVLQITPDIEEEIAEAERGNVVTMGEFKTMCQQPAFLQPVRMSDSSI